MLLKQVILNKHKIQEIVFEVGVIVYLVEVEIISKYCDDGFLGFYFLTQLWISLYNGYNPINYERVLYNKYRNVLYFLLISSIDKASKFRESDRLFSYSSATSYTVRI